MRRSITLSLWLLTTTFACGGTSKHDADAGGNSGAGPGGSGGSGGSTSTAGGGNVSTCPAVVPNNGAACKLPGTGGSGSGFNAADCSWGDDIRPRCRTKGVCSQGKWSLTE